MHHEYGEKSSDRGSPFSALTFKEQQDRWLEWRSRQLNFTPADLKPEKENPPAEAVPWATPADAAKEEEAAPKEQREAPEAAFPYGYRQEAAPPDFSYQQGPFPSDYSRQQAPIPPTPAFPVRPIQARPAPTRHRELDQVMARLQKASRQAGAFTAASPAPAEPAK